MMCHTYFVILEGCRDQICKELTGGRTWRDVDGVFEAELRVVAEKMTAIYVFMHFLQHPKMHWII